MAKKRERPINIPEGVKVKVENTLISVEGPKGKLERDIPPSLKAEITDGQLLLKRQEKEAKVIALQGLFHTLITNMIEGVVKDYEKILEIVGVGYRAKMEEKKLSLFLGFSHPIEVEVPENLEVKVAKTTILIKGIDKELVGNFAASIRKIQPPDVYKGKGIRYQGEYVRHKVGKTAVATTV
ncbi:MAG: 50S ribosomal protein L6 [Candidatus Omnitrophica bacterium]|nr:50S ribosomal protein L6 [Candidatus Omnitrophota bacterium]